MPDANELKAALERLIAGTSSETDCNALRAALTSGVLVTGDRAVALGGSATDVSIATGDHIEFSIRGGDAATVLTALNSITPSRRHQVPPPPADFTGREDEQRELVAAIEDGGVTISGLQGMGGIGKTALALKLVEQLKPLYPDAQIYLDLKGASAQPLSAAEALAHVIRSYHPAANLPDSERELRAMYLSALEGERALLLMDNASGAAQVESLIPPASCVLLVTSRWHFTLPGLAAKNLDALTASDARTLLLAIAPRIGSLADEIAKLCGYLPLALRLAAGALAKYVNLKPADYVWRLQDQQQRLHLIDASISLSYDLLNEPLRERWTWLAVFPDSFADDAAEAVWGVETEEAQNQLSELLAASMVEWNETADRYRLHDLARLFADARLSYEARAVGHKRHARHYKDVLATADKLYLQGGEALVRGLALFDREWGNIQTGHTWVAAQGITAHEEVARLGIAYTQAGLWILLLRQHVRERFRWFEIALATARRLKDREHEGYALGNLGIAYRDIGEIRRAIQMQEQFLTIARERSDRKGEGTALSNLGIAYRDLGENRRALQFQEQYLTIARERSDRKSEGLALSNLGITYRALGENKRAIQLQEQSLAIVRELGYRSGEGVALCNLGNVYYDLNDTQRAIQFYEEYLTIARELGDRSGEGSALGNLGNCYYSRDETQRALHLYEQRLTIAREIGDPRGEGNALWNISLALDRLGQRVQGIQHAEQSLKIYEQIEDPNAARVRAKLAAWREETN